MYNLSMQQRKTKKETNPGSAAITSRHKEEEETDKTKQVQIE